MASAKRDGGRVNTRVSRYSGLSLLDLLDKTSA